MHKIFISYRRDDSADVTGRINDRLRTHFAKDEIFTDVDNIPFGADFRSHIDEAVSQCQVLLAVIGRNWLTQKNARGGLRLHDQADFVRVEIESALRRKIPVIPLLVHGIEMPPVDELPESIQDLAFRNGVAIRRDPDFHSDMDRLISGVESLFGSDPKRQKVAKAVAAQAVVQQIEPLTVFQDELKKGGKGPKMVVIPAGSFLMGSPEGEFKRRVSEGPQHSVDFAEAFALGQTAVTFAEYDRFAKATGRQLPSDENWGRGSRPVINVSWNDAQAYAKWLSEQTKEQYRLPSEAEWEYACRAGTNMPFSSGEVIVTDQINYNGNSPYRGDDSKGEYRKQTVPVATLLANPWGLYEMHGNIWEWTADCWHRNYTDAPYDGTAWLEGLNAECNRRVIRGGAWCDKADLMRSATRSRSTISRIFYELGFRLVKVFW